MAERDTLHIGLVVLRVQVHSGIQSLTSERQTVSYFLDTGGRETELKPENKENGRN